MTAFLVACALVLLMSVLAGLWRVVRGPTTADRMLAAQLFGTTGVAILLVEQNARAALQIADHGYVLETGEVSLAGPSAELGVS